MSEPVRHPPISDLSFQILLALGEGPQHGYAIIRDIEERTGGSTTIRSGTLYTAIQRLQEAGLVAAVPPPVVSLDARRKYYALTDPGRQAAVQEAARLGEMLRTGAERQLVPPGMRVVFGGEGAG